MWKLRPIAYDCFKYEIKNEHYVFFWSDNWLGLDRLIEIIGDVGTRYLGVNQEATLSEAVHNAGWNLRARSKRVFSLIYQKIQALPTPDSLSGPDIPLWKHGTDDYRPVFSSAKIWEYICISKDHLMAQPCWFSQGILRQSFMVWLAIKDRLSTGIRMKLWRIIQGCIFCGERNDDRT